MRLRIIVLVLLSLLLITVAMAAQTVTNEGPVTEPAGLLVYAIPLIAALVSFALGRFMKWNVDVQRLIPIITTIIKAIFKVEVDTLGKDPPKSVVDYDEYRSKLAADIAENSISGKSVPVLKKVFGNTIGAVKIIFPLIKPGLNLLKQLKK